MISLYPECKSNPCMFPYLKQLQMRGGIYQNQANPMFLQIKLTKKDSHLCDSSYFGPQGQNPIWWLLLPMIMPGTFVVAVTLGLRKGIIQLFFVCLQKGIIYASTSIFWGRPEWIRVVKHCFYGPCITTHPLVPLGITRKVPFLSTGVTKIGLLKGSGDLNFQKIVQIVIFELYILPHF